MAIRLQPRRISDRGLAKSTSATQRDWKLCAMVLYRRWRFKSPVTIVRRLRLTKSPTQQSSNEVSESDGWQPLRNRRLLMREFILFFLISGLGLGCLVRSGGLPAKVATQRLNIRVGASPSCVVIADLNRDGKGNFRPAPGSPFTVQSKPHPHGIVVADFKGDGKLDLATDDWQNNRITVVFNNGTGGFLSPGVSFAVGKMPYYKLRAADLNKDGRADLVTTNFEGGNVTILLANGKGAFKEPKGSPFESNKQKLGVDIRDLNGDGNTDLAVAHYSGHITDTSGDRMSILLGAGDGTFRLAWSQLVPGKAPTSAAIGDINGDGIADVVFGNYGDASVSVVLGSRREFLLALDSPLKVGSKPSGIAVGDLNGDGKADIVTANEESNDISVLLTK